ncbi:triosephosphate isomerase-like [Diorhabda carinulata]|uniref:triosephosphate isomerase-like n=1 Tax=Diorhabda carinulata TaxID=1163345 RepID=UPI0025A006A5|nr:triosephosphate isomerase-like [Diorhabda carinulata]
MLDIVCFVKHFIKLFSNSIQKCSNFPCPKQSSNKRKFIVGGNLKMNGNRSDIMKILKTLKDGRLDSNTEVFIAVPAVYLDLVKCNIPSNIQLAAQNCYKEEKGAFTGEVSPLMLTDIGVQWVILGHSERRHIFNETDELIAAKVALAKKSGLQVVACVGETLAEREAGKTMAVVIKQINAIESQLKGNWTNVILAYEPVWAIGTGKTATPEQAQTVHENIRCFFKDCISFNVAEGVRIQYGGSVTAKNCKKLASQPDIDGFLVGGASLKPEFVDIINAKS